MYLNFLNITVKELCNFEVGSTLLSSIYMYYITNFAYIGRTKPSNVKNTLLVYVSVVKFDIEAINTFGVLKKLIINVFV